MLITEKIFDVSTGEETIIERKESAAEKEIRETKQAEFIAAQAEAEAKATQRQAILDRIGLTADELKTILG